MSTIAGGPSILSLPKIASYFGRPGIPSCDLEHRKGGRGKSAKEMGIRVFEKAYCNDGVDGGCHEEQRDGVHHRNDGLRKRAYNNP